MIRQNVAEILDHHVTFELEAIDRMYLNAYVPSVQTGAGFAYFVKTHLGVRVPSTVMIAPITQRFVEAIERFIETQGVDLVTFEKGQRKDDVAQEYLAAFDGDEGVLFVGKAQEKASVFRTEKRYATLVYHQAGSYEETARRIGIDRRTVRSRIDRELLARLERDASSRTQSDENSDS